MRRLPDFVYAARLPDTRNGKLTVQPVASGEAICERPGCVVAPWKDRIGNQSSYATHDRLSHRWPQKHTGCRSVRTTRLGYSVRHRAPDHKRRWHLRLLSNRPSKRDHLSILHHVLADIAHAGERTAGRRQQHRHTDVLGCPPTTADVFRQVGMTGGAFFLISQYMHKYETNS